MVRSIVVATVHSWTHISTSMMMMIIRMNGSVVACCGTDELQTATSTGTGTSDKTTTGIMNSCYCWIHYIDIVSCCSWGWCLFMMCALAVTTDGRVPVVHCEWSQGICLAVERHTLHLFSRSALINFIEREKRHCRSVPWQLHILIFLHVNIHAVFKS